MEAISSFSLIYWSRYHTLFLNTSLFFQKRIAIFNKIKTFFLIALKLFFYKLVCQNISAANFSFYNFLCRAIQQLLHF